MLDKRTLGIMPDGREVTLFSISNNSGEYVELLDYGATIHSINVRDKDGNLGDVVLGTDNMDELLDYPYEGSTIGRCANRIAYGCFTINGVETRLECNRGNHFIHGGSGNYARKTFTAITDELENSVTFILLDIGEGGFNCSADVKVKFTFEDDHKLGILYEILPHGDTVICPTNHSYFNMSGAGDIREDYLKVYSNEYAPKGEIGIPVGELKCVKETPLNFTYMRQIGEALAEDNTGFFTTSPSKYDDSYILENKGFDIAAELYSRKTGRIMRVFTDMPALILFTPYAKKPRIGKRGVQFSGYCGVCLETQYVPNAVNCAQYTSPIYKKNELMCSKTIYEFGVINSEDQK